MDGTNYINPLPGVPSVESPFFDEMFDRADPIYGVAKAFSDNGFVVIDFPDPDVHAIADRIKQDLHDRYAWGAWHAGGTDMRLQDAWKFNEDVLKIATNPQIIDLLSRLYGRRAFAFQTLNFPVGTQQHFHTDSIHFSSRPERFMCGVWLALEDIGPDQGPLVYYPTSHKWPVYTHEHIGHTYIDDSHQAKFEPLWERLVEKKGVTPARFAVKKGQALIWAANLLHGGDVHNDKNRTRWSQVSHYFFEDCAYYSPLMSNEILGEYHYRRPYDIATGGNRDNRFNGEAVPITDSAVGAQAVTEPPAQVPADFDTEAYLILNPDVASRGGQAVSHYLQFGWKEGRRWR